MLDLALKKSSDSLLAIFGHAGVCIYDHALFDRFANVNGTGYWPHSGNMNLAVVFQPTERMINESRRVATTE